MLQTRRARAQEILRPPPPEHRVAHDERHRKRGQQLEEFGGCIDPAQHRHLDQRTHCRSEDCGHRHAPPEAQRGASPEPLDAAVREVDAQHVQRAMGEVDDARDAEDQRQPHGHQEERRRARQPVQELDEQAVPGHCITRRAASLHRFGRTQLADLGIRRLHRCAVDITEVLHDTTALIDSRGPHVGAKRGLMVNGTPGEPPHRTVHL